MGGVRRCGLAFLNCVVGSTARVVCVQSDRVPGGGARPLLEIYCKLIQRKNIRYTGLGPFFTCPSTTDGFFFVTSTL